MVVLEDADVEAAAEASLVASFLCAGQSCTAGERFLVHESVHDAFVERAARRGRALDPARRPARRGDDDGAAQQRADRARRWIATSRDALDRGAELVAGGSRAAGHPDRRCTGRRPCSTGVTEEMEVAREETFGPVIPITKISSDEEALQIANASPYGLLTAVWTRDLARGLRFAEAVDAGWVNVNESTNYWESHLPFGGRAGTSSGVGRVGGSSLLDAFTEPKTVVLTLA